MDVLQDSQIELPASARELCRDFWDFVGAIWGGKALYEGIDECEIVVHGRVRDCLTLNKGYLQLGSHLANGLDNH